MGVSCGYQKRGAPFLAFFAISGDLESRQVCRNSRPPLIGKHRVPKRTRFSSGRNHKTTLWDGTLVWEIACLSKYKVSKHGQVIGRTQSLEAVMHCERA